MTVLNQVDRVEINYSDIPGFGESTGQFWYQLIRFPSLNGFEIELVQGHKSALAFGFLGKNRTPVVAQLGRWVITPVLSELMKLDFEIGFFERLIAWSHQIARIDCWVDYTRMKDFQWNQ